MADNTLIIDDLHVNVAGKEILKGVDLEIKQGEIHALLGPNGSGKSTLAYTIAGHPKYEVTQGRIIWQGEDVLAMSPDERRTLGIPDNMIRLSCGIENVEDMIADLKQALEA